MYFKTELLEDGEYLRDDGQRFAMQQARRVRPTDGWTKFETLDAALETWGLRYAPMG